MAGEGIAKLLKEGTVKGQEMADLVLGRVESTSPLQINVENRFVIGEEFLILSKLVQKKEVEYIYPKVTVEDGSHTSSNVTISGQEVSYRTVGDVDRDQPEVPYYFYNGEKVSKETSYAKDFYVKSVETKMDTFNIPDQTSSKPYVEEVTHTKVTVKDEVRKILLWDDLQVGEEVRMIRSQGGQTYYVLDRR